MFPILLPRRDDEIVPGFETIKGLNMVDECAEEATGAVNLDSC